MKVKRNSGGLADAMFDELDALNNGSSTPQQARAKSAIANSIISLTRLEMEYARFITDQRADRSNNEAHTSWRMPCMHITH